MITEQRERNRPGYVSRWLKAGRGQSFRLAMTVLCASLVMPGLAVAKKPVQSDAGCAIFPADIHTGHPFTIKVVRDPAYTGSWSQPTLVVRAEFSKTDGSKTVLTSEDTTISKYGVTYINAALTAPACNGMPCEIDYLSGAALTALVREPINKGKRYRETVCTPVTATVNVAN